MGIMDLFKKKSSGNVAKDRLKLVLVSDRANCSSEMMEMMKRDCCLLACIVAAAFIAAMLFGWGARLTKKA